MHFSGSVLVGDYQCGFVGFPLSRWPLGTMMALMMEMRPVVSLSIIPMLFRRDLVDKETPFELYERELKTRQ